MTCSRPQRESKNGQESKARFKKTKADATPLVEARQSRTEGAFEGKNAVGEDRSANEAFCRRVKAASI
jgi:hypothetical protein